MGLRSRSIVLLALLLAAPLSGCVVPENMTALREELGYASVELPDIVVKARASTLEPRVHETVTLTAEVEGIPEDQATVRWQLGDATARGITVERTWTTPGPVPVNVTVEGPQGQQVHDQLTLTVHENQPPVARISIEGAADASEDTALVLSGEGSSDADGDPLNYTWLVDGDDTFEGPRVERTFEPGAHRVKLVVDDGYAQTAAFDTFAVADPLSKEGTLDTETSELALSFPIQAGADKLAVTLTHTTRLGAEDVDLVLLDDDGEEIAASRTDPAPGNSTAGEQITVPGEDLSPGAYTLEARLERGISSDVTIEGVLTYSPLSAEPG